MPDLEEQIAGWRRSMAQATGPRAELLTELEEHLREEIDRLHRAGVSSGKAFEIAVLKLGAPVPVAAEFDKLLAAPVTWLPIKLARIGLVVSTLLLVVLFGFRLEKAGLLLSTHVVCVTLGYLMTFVAGGVGICALLSQWPEGWGPTRRQALLGAIFQFAILSAILTGIGIFLGAVWSKNHLGRYWDWDLKETGACLVFVWTLLIASLRWSGLGQAATVFLVVLGNPVTAWAWFGANSGGMPGPFLVAFITAHLLFLTSSLARVLTGSRRNSTSKGQGI